MSKIHCTTSRSGTRDSTRRKNREGNVFRIIGGYLVGPFYLFDGSKSWIVLFKFAVHWAIPLDLGTSLFTETFTQVSQRFIAKRGRCYVISSNNGTKFVDRNKGLAKVDRKAISEVALAERNRGSEEWWWWRG
ncbi:hypothetical protein NPIL_164131 [Nephila pilipes]|uniref:Uncharacterized protein n=1 Tax=Nephila pilipes TaxID=299642 RepID=A0A8X6N1R1_NEPPI|nr:hypothetical protein NPIL_164131 [Nephila pilipes]